MNMVAKTKELILPSESILPELYRNASVTRWMVSSCRIRTYIDKSQRLVTNDLTAFAQKYAEDSALGNGDEMAILTKAAIILRKKTLLFMKEDKKTLSE